RVAASSSLLYAKNLYAFLETLIDKETKQLSIDPEDELVKATMLTHGGKVVHPNFQSASADAAATASPPADPEIAKAAKGTEPGLDVAPKKTRSRSAAATAKPAGTRKAPVREAGSAKPGGGKA